MGHTGIQKGKGQIKYLNKIIGQREVIPHEEYLTPNNTYTYKASQ